MEQAKVKATATINGTDGEEQKVSKEVDFGFPQNYEEAVKICGDESTALNIFNQQLKIKLQAYMRGKIEENPEIEQAELQSVINNWNPSMITQRKKKDTLTEFFASLESGQITPEQIKEFEQRLIKAKQAAKK